MQVGGAQSVANFSYLQVRTTHAGKSSTPIRDYSADRVALGGLFSDLGRLRGELGRFDQLVDGLRQGREGGGSAFSFSDAPLGLSLTSASATLRSTDEINTLTTSYAPESPSFSGLSSTSPTVSGTYDGSNGDDTLNFSVTSGGIVGLASPLEIEVRDGTGTLIDTLNYSAFAPAGTTASLSNGLSLSLSSGVLAAGDSFELQVSSSSPQDLNPDATFAAGVGFESGTTIQNGSFTLNGINVSVSTSDTLNDVLARITASAAGVDAVYEVGSDTVLLTAKTPGSEGDFAFDGDDSGLIAALKLDGAERDRGSDDQRAIALNRVPSLAAVAAGNFKVNGHDLSVNPAVDSLNDVLARIEAAAPGVSASYHNASGRVRVISNNPGVSLALDDGTSGLFSALGIDPGTITTDPGTRRITGLDSGEVGRRLERIGRQLADVLDRRNVVNADIETGRLRSNLSGGLRALFAREKIKSLSSTVFSTTSGITVDLSTDAESRITFDMAKFRNEAKQHPDTLLRSLFGSSSESPGLFDVLSGALDELEGNLVERYGEGGSLLDVLA